ncbi:MAG: methylmalonyl-CoA epimerase [Gemmatimonadota bacterium]
MRASKPHPVDHIGIAVVDFDDALPILELVTGAHGSPPERIASQGVEVVFLGEGDGKLELLRPLSSDSPVARFLERRGPGLHHVAYRVPDVAAALADLTAQGLQAIDDTPRAGARGHSVAFLHPKSTARVLIELVEH